MNETVKLLAEYGIMIVIVGLFVWDWITNKTSNKDSLKTIADTNKSIVLCLEEIKKTNSNNAKSNDNISKSLELLQKSMDNQTQKIDKLLERGYRDGRSN